MGKRTYTKTEWNSTIPAVPEQINRMETGIKESIDHGNENEDSIAEVNKKIGSITEKTDGLDESIATINEKDNSQDLLIQEITSAQNEAEENIRDLKEKVSTNTASISANTSAITKETEDRKKALEATDGNVSALTERVSTAETNIKTNTTNIATNKESIENNAKAISTEEGARTKAVSDLDTSLTKKVTDEAAARSKAISDETKARSDADEALNERLNAAESESSMDTFLKRYYNMQKTGKLYGVKVWKFASNPSSTLVKTRDNEGLVCETSTNTVEGKDDYADIPMFKWMNVNYKRHADGFAYPTAIEGDDAYTNTGNVDVGCMQMTFYYRFIENDDYKELVVSDSPNHALMMKPFEEAVRADGTVMPYFIFSKYHSSLGSDGLLHSIFGAKPERNQSYNNELTNYAKKGEGYYGSSIRRQTFGMLMLMTKYATKNSQNVFAGVTGWNIQYKASVESDEPHNYFPVTNAQANGMEVGLYVSVGHARFSDNSLDRGCSEIHKYADDVRITKIETLDDNNKAVYLDCEPFTTTPVVNEGTSYPIYITSMHAWSGDTDEVINHHDGSNVSVSNSRHPYRIQGLEFNVGGYTIPTDAVMMFTSDYSKDVYYAKRGIARSTNETTIRNTYEKVGNIPNSGEGVDYWIGDVEFVDGCWYPSAKGASNSQGFGDMLYAGGKSTSGGREYLMGGALWFWSFAGLACLHCGSWLGGAYWYSLSLD